MDPTLPLILVGSAGGIVIAWALLRAPRWSPAGSLAAGGGGRNGRQRDVINVSAIRVAGVGGLALVGMAARLAWTFPSIAQSLMLGSGLGLLLALMLILYRRRTGPMPSSGRQSAANTTLRLQ